MFQSKDCQDVINQYKNLNRLHQHFWRIADDRKCVRNDYAYEDEFGKSKKITTVTAVNKNDTM